MLARAIGVATTFMIADAMIDTNVLVYAASVLEADQGKSDVARSILQNERVGVSAQVMQEFLVATTRKVRRTWSLDECARLDRGP